MEGRNRHSESIGDTFHDPSNPTIVRSYSGGPDFSASRITQTQPNFGLTKSIVTEPSILVCWQLVNAPKSLLWIEGKEFVNPPHRANQIEFYDLSLSCQAYLESPFETVHMCLSRAMLDDLADEDGHARFGEITVPHGHSMADSLVPIFGRAILPALNRPNEANKLFSDYVAVNLAAYLMRTYGQSQRRERSVARVPSSQISQAMELMEANLTGTVSLAELAATCKLSKSHFSRAFTQATGLPPHRWLLNRRVELSKVMLKEPDSDLAAVALNCGFADQSHFSRVFKACVGVSPGRWRTEVYR